MLATAGLRLLAPAHAEGLLAACRGELASSKFAFRHEWASVIPGAPSV
jgi:hypothetical protein